MPNALDEQIAAYEALLPAIRKTHGSAWILMADRRVVEAFATFPAAARFAQEHFSKKQVLIRHTDEKKFETAPFVQVRAEE